MKNFIGFLIALAILPIIFIYMAFSWGFVASKLALWFITPLFPQFPVLNWVEYAGVMLFVNCFIHNYNNENLKKELKNENQSFLVFINPWILLVLGFLFKTFIN